MRPATLARIAAKEGASARIRVNSILPGWIVTDMTEKRIHGEGFMTKVLPRVPMRRWGEGSDFGGIAVYLASDASAYATGEQFLIDGGYGKIKGTTFRILLNR